MPTQFQSKELTPDTWQDFVRLFEKHAGVWGGCWCMYFQVPTDWSRRSSEQNRAEKERLVNEGRSHGVLVYVGGQPVGWCQFGPRLELPRIDRKRGYRPSSRDGLWRITCFFIDKDHRKMGVATEALRAALTVMKLKGARTVEAYPVVPAGKRYSSSMLWMGTKQLYFKQGFKQVQRLGKSVVVAKRLFDSRVDRDIT